MKMRVEGLNEGLMVYWEEVKEAAVYHVHLIIGDANMRFEEGKLKQDPEVFNEIDVVDVSRQTKYYSFVNLAPIHRLKVPHFRTNNYCSGRNYYIIVEAEDRTGRIIDKTNKTRGEVNIPESNVQVVSGRNTVVI